VITRALKAHEIDALSFYSNSCRLTVMSPCRRLDRQLKSGFGTYEAAEKAAKEIRKRYPNLQLTVFDAKKRSHTAIE